MNSEQIASLKAITTALVVDLAIAKNRLIEIRK